VKRSMTPVALALAVAGLVAVWSLAGPTATASATTSIDQLNSLTFPHMAVRSEICSTQRRIRLGGRYRFQAYSAHRKHREARVTSVRELRLRGVYRWHVCLHRDRPGSYRITAYLENVATGGEASINHNEPGIAYGNGYYDWGSTLDNAR
jgi:hypothetical protein